MTSLIAHLLPLLTGAACAARPPPSLKEDALRVCSSGAPKEGGASGGREGSHQWELLSEVGMQVLWTDPDHLQGGREQERGEEGGGLFYFLEGN